MRRRLLFLAVGVLLAVAWPVAAQQRVFLSLATGGTAGVYFPLGAALAELWSGRVPNVQVTAQTSGASVANIRLLQRGDVAIAMVQNDITYYAFNGIEMFMDRIANQPAPVATLRGMAMLYPETIQVVTLRSKNINSIAELRGRRIAVGAPGSGTEVNARQILRMFELGYYNTRPDFLNFAEAADQVKDGVVDAAFITAGHPTAAVQDIAASRDLKLLPVPREVVEQLRVQWPYYTAVTIPANTYRGQTEAVDTVAVMAMLVTRQDVDEALVYSLTRTMWENVDRLRAAHARGRDVTTATARRGMPITMHAGALRFYREFGIR
ncbi:MAG: TAXI family TRAP transporter solute-binding subunit [Armatimonadota bacterium]|nr:TAXI family TRAP transporter solute-binding subunit [Armatimonadota bacterium]MDR7498028.1 TAXI family TRAP transporter solute-binding subunit [Armatimonadota bacterium]MDR7513165.1 TAXI family TRAP transporter solute-binding subunit [Armatimonadota bacterium]